MINNLEIIFQASVADPVERVAENDDDDDFFADFSTAADHQVSVRSFFMKAFFHVSRVTQETLNEPTSEWPFAATVPVDDEHDNDDAGFDDFAAFEFPTHVEQQKSDEKNAIVS